MCERNLCVFLCFCVFEFLLGLVLRGSEQGSMAEYTLVRIRKGAAKSQPSSAPVHPNPSFPRTTILASPAQPYDSASSPYTACQNSDTPQQVISFVDWNPFFSRHGVVPPPQRKLIVLHQARHQQHVVMAHNEPRPYKLP